MQNSNATICGSFCKYIAYLVFGRNFNCDASDFVYANDYVLKRFLAHMRSHKLIIT